VPVVREIVDALAAVRFADIAPAPPAEEAEHLRQHTHGADEGSHKEENEKDEEKNEEGEKEEEEREGRSSTGPGPSTHSTQNPTIEDVRALRAQLETQLRSAGLKVDLDLESIP
jgi:hypothetical protein